MHDVAVRPVVWTGIAIAIAIAAVIASVLALLHFGGMPFGGERLANAKQLAAPDLSSAPQDDLARYRREKQARLDSTGWVDPEAGIAHIPISDAMDLLAARAGQGAKR
jgi:hypothetical protein